MKRLLFVQGVGEGTHDQWDNHLVDSLQHELGDGYKIFYPALPNESEPSYAAWSEALHREFAGLRNGDIVVGHSMGATILVYTLAEQPPLFTPGAICLIATPFIGTGGWEGGEIPSHVDLATCLPRSVPIFLYHGTDDHTVPISHLKLYAQMLPQAHVRRLDGLDHQLCGDLSSVALDIKNRRV